MDAFRETILQFGTGRFLRAFVDRFVHEANVQGQNVGSVVVVQSTGDDVANQINASRGVFHIAVRGLGHGAEVRRDEVACVSRCLVASREWKEIIKIGQSPDLRFVVSNTTEKGYNLSPDDWPNQEPPCSFPAKLLAVLYARFTSGMPPLTIMPCELRDNQADELLGIVVALARNWGYPEHFIDWIRFECVWLNSLVDRIVVGGPADHPLTGKDPLLVMAEPFAFWALQGKVGAWPFLEHPSVLRVADIRPFFLRKVRILNAGHTALVTWARGRGYQTVFEAMRDAELTDWLEKLLMEEIVPTIDDRVEGASQFATATLERFRNPFLAHRILDILQNHELKVSIRLAPTRDEFRHRFGREPERLNMLMRENGL